MSATIRFLRKRTFNTHDASIFQTDDGRIGVKVEVERRCKNVLNELVRVSGGASTKALTEHMNRRFHANYSERDILTSLRRLRDEVNLVELLDNGNWRAKRNAVDAWTKLNRKSRN